MQTNMSNLSLHDAAAPPVAHIFTPASRVAENTAKWVEKPASGAMLGSKILTFGIKEPSDPISGVYRIKVTLAVPKMDETVPTAPKMLSIGRANCEFLIPASFTTQEAKDLVRVFGNSLLLGSVSQIGDNIAERTLPY